MTIIVGSMCQTIVYHSVKIVGFDYYYEWKLDRAIRKLAEKTYP